MCLLNLLLCPAIENFAGFDIIIFALLEKLVSQTVGHKHNVINRLNIWVKKHRHNSSLYLIHILPLYIFPKSTLHSFIPQHSFCTFSPPYPSISPSKSLSFLLPFSSLALSFHHRSVMNIHKGVICIAGS